MFAEIKADWEKRRAEIKADWEKQRAEVEAEWEKRCARREATMAKLEGRSAGSRSHGVTRCARGPCPLAPTKQC